MSELSDRNVYPRGKRWWGVFHRPDGESVRKSLGIPLTRPKAEALALWLERTQEPHQADDASGAPCIESAFDDYVTEQKRRGRAEATIEIDEQKAGHFLRIWGRTMPLHLVNAQRVAMYIERREQGASKRTIQRELIVLRGALKLAAHRGLFKTPLEQVMPLGFAPKYVPKKRWLTSAQAKSLIAALPKERRGWAAFVFGTGARRSEVEHARAGDITGDAVYIRGTKTDAADDTIPITSIQRPFINIALHHGPPFEHWTNVLRGLTRACKRAKIPIISPNDMRRSLGMWLRDGGVEPHFIAKVLRHTDSRMAEMVYARGSREGIRFAIEAQLAAVRQAVRHAAKSERHKRQMRQRKQAKTA